MACIFGFAAIGAGVGLALALRLVRQHGYVHLDLWRTSLWTISHGVWVGWALGAASGLLMLLLLGLWSALAARGAAPRETSPHQPLTCRPWHLRLALMLALLTAAAVLALPYGVHLKFGLPYRELVISLIALLWASLGALGAAVATLQSESERSEAWFGLRWLTIICFGALVVFLHVFARVATWQQLAVITAVVAVVFSGIHYWLRATARRIHARTGPALGQVVLGRPGRTVALLLLVMAASLWSTSHWTARRARADAAQRGRNVVIVVIDTLRTDFVSLLSPDEHERDLTPNIREAVAAQGAVFTRAVSQAPWTMPAVASILTGLYPSEHGAEQRWTLLPATRLTLAEILREVGYRTLGVSSALYVTNASGLRQGFEAFDESQALGQITVSSPQVTDRAIQYLRAHEDEPFFLYVHYFDPHWAYQDHEEYDYADGYDGWLRDLSQTLRQDHFEQEVAAARPRPPRRLLDPDEMQFLKALYEEEIAYTDSHIGRLLRHLSDAGLRDNTLVIVVADHGEEFLERGNLGHGATLNEEVIHVPLAIADPFSGRHSIISHPVETRAIFSTVLDFAGVPPPAGAGFSPSLLTEEAEPPTFARSANHTVAPDHWRPSLASWVNLWVTSIQDNRWKLIKEHRRGRTVLFDLEKDPGETRDCRGENPDSGHRLERELDRLDNEVRGRAPRARVPEASEEQQRRLRSLGYL